MKHYHLWYGSVLLQKLKDLTHVWKEVHRGIFPARMCRYFGFIFPIYQISYVSCEASIQLGITSTRWPAGECSVLLCVCVACVTAPRLQDLPGHHLPGPDLHTHPRLPAGCPGAPSSPTHAQLSLHQPQYCQGQPRWHAY